jgi:hypothetical protein
MLDSNSDLPHWENHDLKTAQFAIVSQHQKWSYRSLNLGQLSFLLRITMGNRSHHSAPDDVLGLQS